IENQLTTSQEDFSSQWLHKSPRYYATIKSSRRNASIEALSTLMVKLYGLGDELHANKHGDKAVLWYSHGASFKTHAEGLRASSAGTWA
ncbi:DUF6626 family protein, partial [Magnetovibrio blakemorei]|uniref:DUF6626 family protein n=1 Tax=Magnetovibrio blakemorei TaxID=28181 RepID=UPI001B8C4FA7